ncbi:hypothetical protein [Curtobacterium sp. MCBA15_012]|uniref:hypothetical protein n=1 Tax=Curtobacterium sp. MCBA15_012 TaxID=1898738 RepID=UPI0008DE9244|nr:hypothetical protein [Curtobacterium sp. MCBA15_012]WIA99709.1 hypothetical protein QOL15_14540 [Curtobacterium sp. MCBA15_012]
MIGAEFHRQAMEDALADAAEQTAVDRKTVALAEAQVHATALLAEEQRTANLIALFDEEGPEVFRAPEISATSIGTPVELRQARRAASEAVRTQYLVLAAEIAERLALA